MKSKEYFISSIVKIVKEIGNRFTTLRQLETTWSNILIVISLKSVLGLKNNPSHDKYS